MLARIHLADEGGCIQQERVQVQQRLKRLARTYVDGLCEDDDYRREKWSLEEKLAGLIVPGVNAASEAGKLLEDLPSLWGLTELSERRKLLLAMLEAVYVGTVEEKAILAIRPRSAFMPIFEVATTQEQSNVVLIREKIASEPSMAGGNQSVFLVETGGSRTPRPRESPVGYATSLASILFLPREASTGGIP